VRVVSRGVKSARPLSAVLGVRDGVGYQGDTGNMYVMASEAAASPAHSGKQERKCKVRSGEGKRRIMMRAQDQILRNIE
jgi:hypothetical protein